MSQGSNPGHGARPSNFGIFASLTRTCGQDVAFFNSIQNRVKYVLLPKYI